MKKDAETKNEIIQEIEKLNQELEELNFSIAKKEEIKNEYDKVIMNTNLAYNKLLEGSKVLLAILKRDEANLQKKLGDNYSIFRKYTQKFHTSKLFSLKKIYF